MKLNLLVGSGRKIGIFFLPFLLVGVILNMAYPDFFDMGGPPFLLFWFSIFMLMIGIVNWIWTIVLLLTKVPRKELICSGPYALVKHPLYVGMAFLVIPWIGLLLNTWIGVVLGLALYVGSRLYSPEEEKFLLSTFGKQWEDYCQKVLLPWV
jgi:protein-S-isoprenylcysteine O-methyltransferase Ste14